MRARAVQSDLGLMNSESGPSSGKEGKLQPNTAIITPLSPHAKSSTAPNHVLVNPSSPSSTSGSRSFTPPVQQDRQPVTDPSSASFEPAMPTPPNIQTTPATPSPSRPRRISRAASFDSSSHIVAEPIPTPISAQKTRAIPAIKTTTSNSQANLGRSTTPQPLSSASTTPAAITPAIPRATAKSGLRVLANRRRSTSNPDAHVATPPSQLQLTVSTTSSPSSARRLTHGTTTPTLQLKAGPGKPSPLAPPSGKPDGE
jgi:hypothetical protein